MIAWSANTQVFLGFAFVVVREFALTLLVASTMPGNAYRSIRSRGIPSHLSHLSRWRSKGFLCVGQGGPRKKDLVADCSFDEVDIGCGMPSATPILDVLPAWRRKHDK